ncbi:MAG: hypothetical protein AAFX65_13855 [Cyanobacteria bacterium J06638_7]
MTNTINGWGRLPITDTPRSGWSAYLRPGTYAIGDPAHVLTSEEYDELRSLERADSGQRFCTLSNHKQVLLIDTGGDRTICDRDGREYPIDTGSLAVLRADHASLHWEGLAHGHNFPEGASVRLNERTETLTFAAPTLVIEAVTLPPEVVDDGREYDDYEIGSANRCNRVDKAVRQLKRALAAAIEWDAYLSPETEVDPSEVLRELAEHVRAEQLRWSGEEVAHD